MGVDKVKFIEDVKKLRQQGVIVYDKEIIATTGVAKSSLSAYLKEDNPIQPSKPFIKKFYEAYGESLDVLKVAEPSEQYIVATTKKYSEDEKAAL